MVYQCYTATLVGEVAEEVPERAAGAVPEFDLVVGLDPCLFYLSINSYRGKE